MLSMVLTDVFILPKQPKQIQLVLDYQIRLNSIAPVWKPVSQKV